jgi:hypothetical protein
VEEDARLTALVDNHLALYTRYKHTTYIDTEQTQAQIKHTKTHRQI